MKINKLIDKVLQTLHGGGVSVKIRAGSAAIYLLIARIT